MKNLRFISVVFLILCTMLPAVLAARQSVIEGGGDELVFNNQNPVQVNLHAKYSEHGSFCSDQNPEWGQDVFVPADMASDDYELIYENFVTDDCDKRYQLKVDDPIDDEKTNKLFYLPRFGFKGGFDPDDADKAWNLWQFQAIPKKGQGSGVMVDNYSDWTGESSKPIIQEGEICIKKTDFTTGHLTGSISTIHELDVAEKGDDGVDLRECSDDGMTPPEDEQPGNSEPYEQYIQLDRQSPQQIYSLPLKYACENYTFEIVEFAQDDADAWQGLANQGEITLDKTDYGYVFEAAEDSDYYFKLMLNTSDDRASSIRVKMDITEDISGLSYKLRCVNPRTDGDADKQVCQQLVGNIDKTWSDAVNESYPSQACCGDDGAADYTNVYNLTAPKPGGDAIACRKTNDGTGPEWYDIEEGEDCNSEFFNNNNVSPTREGYPAYECATNKVVTWKNRSYRALPVQWLTVNNRPGVCTRSGGKFLEVGTNLRCKGYLESLDNSNLGCCLDLKPVDQDNDGKKDYCDTPWSTST